MITIGAFEAKTNLSALLDKVEAGEEIVITRHGRAVARLISENQSTIARRRAAGSQILELQQKNTLGGLSWRELRDEGRK